MIRDQSRKIGWSRTSMLDTTGWLDLFHDASHAVIALTARSTTVGQISVATKFAKGMRGRLRKRAPPLG
jgi:hypothetical protein